VLSRLLVWSMPKHQIMMILDPDYWRAWAQETRAKAELTQSDGARERLSRIAEEYERLAQFAEERRQVSNKQATAVCERGHATQRGSKTMKFGPFPFLVISPFAGVQLWTCSFVLNPSGLSGLAVELSS
jgi:hypothetical protein